MRKNMRAWPAAVITLVACVSPAEKREREAAVARSAVAVESAKAAAVATQPVTDQWDEPHLVERLVRSGLAPQALSGEKTEPYWGVPVHAYRVGGATLRAYIFTDSAARHRITDALDSLTMAPPGKPSPYPLPRMLIVQNNLAAVVLGGNERQQERVSLALAAGLPVSGNR
jgi:hypothetical protein